MSRNLLVSTNWLAEHLFDDHLRIVDIRGRVVPASEPPPHYFSHRVDYETSHIPGAVFVDWTQDIVDPASPSNDIASPARFASFMGQLGIDDTILVIAYDDADGMFASRLWWALNYYGHSKVAVLNGGWKKWIDEDRSVSHEVTEVKPSRFITKQNPHLLATSDEILSMNHANTKLWDIRSGKEFAGQSSRARRKGHIPGAVNLSRKQLVALGGVVPSISEIRSKLSEIEISDPSESVIVYCNAGVSASYGMLALRVAGFENVRVYDGSWKEWGNDDTKPIERS